MADKNFRIAIDTSQSNPEGIDRTAESINRLVGIEDRLKLSVTDFLTAAEREAAEVERMVSSAKRLAAAKEEESKAFFRSQTAAEKEQASLDVLEAKRRQATRAADAHTASTAKFGQVVNQVGFQVTDFAVQVSSGTSAITAFAQQAPQAAGAIQQFGTGMKLSWDATVGMGTAIGVTTAAVGVASQLIMAEYGKMKAAQDAALEAQNRASDLTLKIIELRKQIAQEIRNEFIASINREEAEYLERQVKALERINELRAAQGGAAAAQAAADLTIAQNTGGNVTQAKANQIAITADNQIDALLSRIATAEAATATAANALEAANRVLAEERAKGDINLQSFKDANTAAEKAQAALDEARATEENQRLIYQQALTGIKANTAAQVNTLETEANATLVAAAQQALAAIQQKADETGNNLSSGAREAFTGLQRVLEDGVIKPEEMGRLIDALVRLKVSREGADKEILQAVNSLTTSSENLISTLPELKSRIARLEANSAQ